MRIDRKSERHLATRKVAVYTGARGDNVRCRRIQSHGANHSTRVHERCSLCRAQFCNALEVARYRLASVETCYRTFQNSCSRLNFNGNGFVNSMLLDFEVKEFRSLRILVRLITECFKIYAFNPILKAKM